MTTRTGAERQAAYRARQRAGQVITIDALAVTCHCEATVLHVPRTQILAGRTDTCGRPHCTDPRAAT